MTLPPWLILVMVGALALALVYQIVSRRFGWRILAYWLLLMAGILGAEAMAEVVGFNATRLGDLRLGPDVLGASFVVLVLWALHI